MVNIINTKERSCRGSGRLPDHDALGRLGEIEEAAVRVQNACFEAGN
jgi:hypothetical protein